MVMEILPTKREQVPLVGALEKYGVFTTLTLATVLSTLLLAGDVHSWILPKNVYDFVVENRASTPLIVQICAAALGGLHGTIIRVLINYSSRLRFATVAVSLDTLRFWTNLLSQHLEWTTPIRYLIPRLAFIGLFLVPSALWAAAITPISVIAFRQQTIELASYSDITLLDTNWTNRDNGLSLRNSKGLFTYNVGEEFLGSLLASASSATTIDGSARQHSKMDLSRFTYNNRSYGIGASVGLVDDDISLDPLVTQYNFQEAGYAPTVTCIYNTSSQYFISATPSSEGNFIYPAYGFLPNSNWDSNQGEWSRYIGYSTDSIVAIGVATYPAAVSRMIGIAAGINYANLNNTQCLIDFRPALFNVTVDLPHRNITVTPIEGAVNITDIEPSGLLSFLTTWQLTLISTDQTSFYTSLVGNSINASINNFITSTKGTVIDPTSEAEVTLAGLGNSVTAMIDDILTNYASAQLMVAKKTQTVPLTVGFHAQRLGQRSYIIAVVIINSIIILLVLLEAYRTRGWKDLVDFDYMDPRNLIIGSSRGGQGIAAAADDRGPSDNTAERRVKTVSNNIGRLRIVQVGDKYMSANSGSHLKVERYSTPSEAIAAGPDERTDRSNSEEESESLSVNETAKGLHASEAIELLTLSDIGEGFNLDEGREQLNLDEEREELLPDIGRQRLLPNDERDGVMSNESTESLLHRVRT